MAIKFYLRLGKYQEKIRLLRIILRKLLSYLYFTSQNLQDALKLSFLSGILAQLTDSLNFIHTKAMSLSSFNHVFLAMVLLAVLLSVISFAAKPVIKKWLIRQSTSLSPMSHSH